MGRVSEAIEQIEEELEEAEKRESDLVDKLNARDEEIQELCNEIAELKIEIHGWEDFGDWVESNYPEAREIYDALEKLKK